MKSVPQVGANMKNGMVEKDNFKIVYVAPMKALAAEMTATFGKRLASLGEPTKALSAAHSLEALSAGN